MISILKKIQKKIKSRSILIFIKGAIRSIYFIFLRKKYGFDRWHISPKEFRPYAFDLIRYINSNVESEGTIVEVGCGLGEIVRNIKSHYLYGFDVSDSVIRAAKYLDKKGKVIYKVGSFMEISDLKIDYLVAVNFIHGIASSDLRKLFETVCSKNDIRHLVVDYVKGDGYPFHHDKSIIPENYKQVYESGMYDFERKIVVYFK